MHRPYLLRKRYDPDADRYFMAMPTPPVALQRAAVSDFVAGGKSDGWWALEDGGNFLCLGTVEQCLVDYKNPARVATVNASPSWTFTPNRGFNGSGALAAGMTDAINTTVTPSTLGGNMTQNSIHMCVYRTMSSNIVSNVGIMGSNGTQDLILIPRATGDVMQARLNNSTYDNYLSGVTNSDGFFLASRTGAAESFGQQNETQGGTITTASLALTNDAIRYLQVTASSGSPSQAQLSYGSFGGGLTPALALLKNARVQTAMARLRAL